MRHRPLSRPVFRLLPALLIASVAVLAGCIHHERVLDSAESSTDNFQKAKAAGIRPVAVGDFTSDTLSDETQYLKDSLVVELQGAGMLDPASGSVIQGQVTDVQMGRTRANITARFTITQAGGRVVYDRELRASSTWPANANVAKAQSAVYRKLIGVLFTDPGFKNAVPR